MEVDDRDADRFRTARDGDHLMCPFQCDRCHFRNLEGRDPAEQNGRDQAYLVCIRRANLDAFWAREASTVTSNLREGRKMMEKLDVLRVNVGRNLPRMGPWPVEDSFGMMIAVATLMRTLDPGRTEATVQYDTARRFRSFSYNLWHAGLE